MVSLPAFAQGTQIPKRMISQKRPWHDCQHPQYGVTCNGTTNDAAAIQTCINAASAVNGIAYLGECRAYIGTTSLELNETVTLMGCGSGTAWGSTQAEAEEACTIIEVADVMTGPAIYIRGDPTNSRGFVDSTGNWGSEGGRVQGIKIVAATACSGAGNSCGAGGIKFDGTYSNEETCTEPGTCPGGCTVDTNCRGAVRSWTIEDVGCYRMNGPCVDMAGNVFDITLRQVHSYRVGDDGVSLRDLADATCNNSGCLPDQITCFDCNLNSCDRDETYCAADSWGGQGAGITYYGGHVQGDYGLDLGFTSGVIGVHMEGDQLSTGNIGIQISGQDTYGFLKSVQSFDNCIKIGVNGSSNQADAYTFMVSVLTNCDTAAIHIEDGGERDGLMQVGEFGTNGADIVDDRPSNTEMIYKVVGLDENDVTYIGSQRTHIGDGVAHNLRLVWNEGENEATDPTMWFINATDLFQFDRDLMIGENTAQDVVLTFDSDSVTDPTFRYDDGDDRFIASLGLQVGGTGSSITAQAANDLALNVDNGQFVELDTMQWKVCATVTGAATVTVDDCNVAPLTGSTNITTINTCNAANIYRELKLLCGAYTGVITDGNNILLNANANLTCTTNDVLLLLCDGTNWLEIARSVN